MSLLNFARLKAEVLQFKLERMSWEKNRAAWRRRFPITPPDPSIIVTFFIPLVAKQKAKDWALVCRNLERTLKSLGNQTNPQWSALICGQDKPENITFTERVGFLRYPTTHGALNDKDQKTRFAARVMARNDRSDRYLFLLDADDIPHPGLVDFILEDNNGQGYSLPLGYSLDLRKGELYFHSDQPGIDYPFTKVCGSSHAIRFDTRKDASQTLHIALSGMHRYTRDNLRERLDIDLGIVPFPAMIYLFNHGTSDQDALRGQDRGIVTLPPLARDVAVEALQRFDPDLISFLR